MCHVTDPLNQNNTTASPGDIFMEIGKVGALKLNDYSTQVDERTCRNDLYNLLAAKRVM